MYTTLKGEGSYSVATQYNPQLLVIVRNRLRLIMGISDQSTMEALRWAGFSHAQRVPFQLPDNNL